MHSFKGHAQIAVVLSAKASRTLRTVGNVSQTLGKLDTGIVAFFTFIHWRMIAMKASGAPDSIASMSSSLPVGILPLTW